MVGFVLLAGGEDLGGWLLASTGVVLTAVGLIGLAVHSGKRRAAHRDESQMRMLKLNYAAVPSKPGDLGRRHRRTIAEGRVRRWSAAGSTSSARRGCADLGLIRRAITLELGKLQSPASLTFRWGHASGDNEERSYWLEEGELRMRFLHRQQDGAWVWPEGGVPYQQGGRERNPAEPEDVEWACALFQTERYLVREHLPSDDQLEVQEPGYYRAGVGVPGS